MPLSYHPIGDAFPTRIPDAPAPTDHNNFDTRAGSVLAALPKFVTHRRIDDRPACDYCKRALHPGFHTQCPGCGAPAK